MTADSALRGVRIAMVVPSLRGGGLERMVHDLSLALQGAGLRLGVFPIGGLGVYADPLRAAGIEVVDCREPKLRIRGFPRRLIAALKTFAPSLIHAHSGTWLPATVAARWSGKPPLVFTDHGRYPPEPRGRAIIERWCARRTSLVVAVSQDLASYLASWLALSSPVRIIPNGIDLARFQEVKAGRREELRASLDVGSRDVLAIAVGRLVPVKNHTAMLQALARAAPQAPGLMLALLGAGPLEAELRALATDLKVADRVRFLGFRADVADCLAAADLWVSTSTTEGMPIALLEALAAGLPIIATAVGGVPETLGSPPAGRLVPPGDAAALAGALVELGNSGEARQRRSQVARARANAYSIDTVAASYAAVYSEILRGRGMG